MKRTVKTPPVDEQKAHLREKLKEIRGQVTTDLCEMASFSTWVYLQTRPEFLKAHKIAAFSSTQTEVNTLPLLEGMLKLGKKLYLPKVSKDKSHLSFYQVEDLKAMSPGTFGILEPPSHHPATLEELDMILVPGLAFDQQGHRLGFGKGFYDRILPQLKASSLSVGLCYSFQVVDQVPYTETDASVKALLHEKGFIICKKGN